MSLLASRGQLPAFRSVFDVAHHYEKLKAADAALPRIYSLTSSRARCLVGPDLASKYGLEQDNQQLVVSVTNRHTLEQTWFNEARTKKPQTFSQDPTAFLDSTGGGERCDFCRWPTLTAEDAGFGRVALQHAVTGSNLFKYAEPGHGVVLFRHHDPLTFDFDQLSDLVNASWLWFLESAQHQRHQQQQPPDQVVGGVGGLGGSQQQLHPFLLWNCLPRAGASQYHGHAQVMLTGVPIPHQARLWGAAAAYSRTRASSCVTTTHSSSSSSSGSTAYGPATTQAPSAAGNGSGPVMGQPQPQPQQQQQQQQHQVQQQQQQQQQGQEVQRGQAVTGDSTTTYYQDLLLAHAEVGLLRQLTLTGPAVGSSSLQQQLQQDLRVAAAASSSSTSSSMPADVRMSDAAAAAAAKGTSTHSASSSSTDMSAALSRGSNRIGSGAGSSGSMATSGSSSSMAMSTDSALPAPASAIAAAEPGIQEGMDAIQPHQQQQQDMEQQQQQEEEEEVEQHHAWVLASLCPLKDMEVVVVGSHLTCPAFQHLLHTGLRTLIEDLGCRTFNVGVLNVDVNTTPHPAVQQCIEQQVQEAQASSSSQQQQTSSSAGAGGDGGGGCEGGSSGVPGTGGAAAGADRSSSSRRGIGRHWQAAVSQPAAALHLGPSSASQEAASYGVQLAGTVAAAGTSCTAATAWLQQVPAAPVIARVVSRGKLTSAASDFGGLEVFGGSSIGHTDPFKVVQALDTRLQQLLVLDARP